MHPAWQTWVLSNDFLFVVQISHHCPFCDPNPMTRPSYREKGDIFPGVKVDLGVLNVSLLMSPQSPRSE